MESYEDHAPQTLSATEDARLREEMLAALRDATYGLTDDGIGAVVTIRRYRALLSSLEELILVGKLNAELRPGVSEDTLLSVHDYVFYARPEQAQLPTRAPGDEL